MPAKQRATRLTVPPPFLSKRRHLLNCMLHDDEALPRRNAKYEPHALPRQRLHGRPKTHNVASRCDVCPAIFHQFVVRSPSLAATLPSPTQNLYDGFASPWIALSICSAARSPVRRAWSAPNGTNVLEQPVKFRDTCWSGSRNVVLGCSVGCPSSSRYRQSRQPSRSPQTSTECPPRSSASSQVKTMGSDVPLPLKYRENDRSTDGAPKAKTIPSRSGRFTASSHLWAVSGTAVTRMPGNLRSNSYCKPCTFGRSIQSGSSTWRKTLSSE